MYPRPIERYFAPTTLEDALRLVAEHHAGVRVLSGGQSLLPLLKDRADTAATIVDLNRVDGLSSIALDDGDLRIGAMVRHAELARNSQIARHSPLLRDAARSIGDPQVRNRGTLGGAIAFADPLSDLPVAALALNAKIVTATSGGAGRTIDVDDFFHDVHRTALTAGEIVREVRFPGSVGAAGGAYTKQAHVSNGYAIISVGVQLTLDASGTCRDASIAVGGLQTMPARARLAGKSLVGTPLDADAVSRAASIAAEEIPAGTDFRASEAYRRNLIAHYVRCLVARACERAGATS